MPAATASYTKYKINDRYTTVTISFGIDLLAGKKRVPRPATGRMAFLIITNSSLIKNYELISSLIFSGSFP